MSGITFSCLTCAHHPKGLQNVLVRVWGGFGGAATVVGLGALLLASGCGVGGEGQRAGPKIADVRWNVGDIIAPANGGSYEVSEQGKSDGCTVVYVTGMLPPSEANRIAREDFSLRVEGRAAFPAASVRSGPTYTIARGKGSQPTLAGLWFDVVFEVPRSAAMREGHRVVYRDLPQVDLDMKNFSGTGKLAPKAAGG